MSRIQARHPHRELDPTHAANFAELLAAHALAGDGAFRVEDGSPSPGAFQRHWCSVLQGLPRSSNDEAVWLIEVEVLALAFAASSTGEEVPSGLFDGFEAALTEVAAWCRDHVWMNLLVAEESHDGPLTDVMPWSAVRSGVASGGVQESRVDPAVLDAWLERRLHREDAEALTKWVGVPGPWRKAYTEQVTELAQQAHVPQLDVERTLSVAASDSELPLARLIQELPLPHLGRQARREGRLHGTGTRWCLVDSGTQQRCTAAYGDAQLEWQDDVLGLLVTELAEYRPSELALAQDALQSVARLAKGQEHPRVLSIARAAAQDLCDGSSQRGLMAAATALDEAVLEAEGQLDWASIVLRTRLALEDLGHRVEDAELDKLVADADEALAPYESGLLLLEPTDMEDIVDGRHIDPATWWGVHARLDIALPTSRIIAAFDDLAEVTVEPPSNLISFAERAATLRSPSIAEDNDGLRVAASTAAPTPGDTNLLVRSDTSRREGRVIRVSVKLGPGGVFAACPEFAPVACDAIRDAYRAAAAMCPAGAPYLLEDHRIVLHSEDTADIAVIDGASLGLAFTLAFASLWLNEALDEHLAATGRLYWRGEWRISAVDGVRAKADALRTAAGAQKARLMANPEHEGEARAAGQELLGVKTVKQALVGAGVDLLGSGLAPAWSDEDTRLDAINELAKSIERQDIARFLGFGEPWALMGDQMVMLVEGLAQHLQDDSSVVAGRLQGAVAYVHAGDVGAAKRLLSAVTTATPWSSVFRAIVELGAAIDTADWQTCTTLDAALARDVPLLPETDRRRLSGLADGTRGRARMHSGDAVGAIGLLEDAVAHHKAVLPRELGRSRVYLACALRNAGRLADAQEQLRIAADDLEGLRGASVPYYARCRTFWLYERARLCLAQSQAEAAVAWALQAYGLVRHEGFYPKLGILRVLACAHRMQGEQEEADLYVDQIRTLKGVPTDSHALRDRILEEAEEHPSPGGEVY